MSPEEVNGAIGADEAVQIGLATLADLERLCRASQPLLASAATRAHAALSRALASLAPEAFDATVP
jgi:hypothetical protein